MEATFTQFGSRHGGLLLFGASPSMSGYQTQTGDLRREEGVQDEDNGLWTRVEVQLLEDKKETVCNIIQLSNIYEKEKKIHFCIHIQLSRASSLNISMLTPTTLVVKILTDVPLRHQAISIVSVRILAWPCQNGGRLFILLCLLFCPSSNKGPGQR